ncbi:jg5740 [Pararge aegeria aegeria]|uniref:Jg5740 protein n=1 Tax=Pararge aegeria aegeria TaxID=348720 RepID=A0A8S4SM28_9NEOP|nr:jg5740 [Pararge aegeria aegeria]
MDTTAPRGGTVIMSDSYRLKLHGVPTSGGWATGTLSRTSATQLAAPAIAGPPLGHTKMSLQSPKAHWEHKVRLPTRGLISNGRRIPRINRPEVLISGGNKRALV